MGLLLVRKSSLLYRHLVFIVLSLALQIWKRKLIHIGSCSLGLQLARIILIWGRVTQAACCHVVNVCQNSKTICPLLKQLLEVERIRFYLRDRLKQFFSGQEVLILKE